MSDYNYLVFPRGKQPTVDEAAEFQNLSGVLAGKFAIGTCRKTGGLVLAFDAEAFSRAEATHRGFSNLVRKWEVRGCVAVDRLSFVKDPRALRPVQPNLWTPEVSTLDRSTSFAKRLAAKELDAKEATAHSLLRVRHTLDRLDSLHRLAAAVPYVLMALGAAGTIGMGFYISGRLLDGNLERRRETTVRVIENPMSQPLESRLPEGN